MEPKPVPRVAVVIAAATLGLLLGCDTERNSASVPAEFRADLIYVTPVTTSGDTLRFLADTGGPTFVYDHVADRYADPDDTTLAAHEAQMPPFARGAGIPPIPGSDGRLIRRAFDSTDFRGDRDGMLGHAWFAGRAWTLDYGNETLQLHPPEWELTGTAATARIHPENSGGLRAAPLPVVDITVDGEDDRFLLDTGATLVLGDEALAEIADGLPARRGTSFVVASVFDAWRDGHPAWRVIEDADRISGEYLYGKPEPIIEVPVVTVAGVGVGPVWFTRRDDDRFQRALDGAAGPDIAGALGGSALQYFVVTIDYRNGVASFRAAD